MPHSPFFQYLSISAVLYSTRSRCPVLRWAPFGLPQDKQKLTAGKALIKYFCSPCKPTKTNGGRKWNLPQHDPDRWKLFKEYNAQDVEAEYAILQRLKSFPMPEIEWDRWRDSVSMNAYGVRVADRVIGGALYPSGGWRLPRSE